MSEVVDVDLERLRDRARAAAQALRAAGIRPDAPPPLDAWLVVQRLDAEADGEPRHSTQYEQIWLTARGELRTARRFCVLHEPDHIEPRAPIGSLEELGSDPSAFAAALESMTAAHVERRAASRAVPEPADSWIFPDGRLMQVSKRWLVGLALATGLWGLWAWADFQAAYGTLLWATPLLALAVVGVVGYLAFVRLGAAGFAVVAGAGVWLLLAWSAYAISTSLWFNDGRACPSIVEALPKGTELCTADNGVIERFIPPLFHFGR